MTTRNGNRSGSLIAATAMTLLALSTAFCAEPPAKPAVEPTQTAETEPKEPVEEENAVQKPAAPTARKPLKLPGLVIDFQKRCVDVEATVCLDQGMLEFIACTKDTKEHESIVVVEARPMHIHTALLVLDATPGHPAMRKPIDENQTRWIDLPPKGDPIDVFLVFRGKNGKMVEHPISQFVTRSDEDPDDMLGGYDGGVYGSGVYGNKAQPDDEENKFPKTFLFAGSLIHDDGAGKRKYLADETGSVISISTFGDELLCLPGVHDKGNQALVWQVDTEHLPKVGSKVTLRLRPQKKAAPKPQAKKPAESNTNDPE